MKSILVFFSILFSSPALYSDWIDLPSPILEKKPYSETAYEEIPRFMKRHQENKTPRQLYELALLNIQIENYSEAKKLLLETLELDPHFPYALIQLGYLDLWEGHDQEASLVFLQELEENKCDLKSYNGLQIIVKKWAHEKDKQNQSLIILTKLHACNPKDPDALLSLGNLLIQMNNWNEAEKTLKECLIISPNYKDASLSLAHIYLLQKKWSLAKDIYEKYPNDLEALKGLARVEGRQGNFSLSEKHYKQALSLDATDQESRKEYAQTLNSTWQFKQAQDQYTLFLTTDPSDDSAWNELLTVKAHTNPSLLFDITYTAAKENDPTLKVPVVKDFYLYSDIHSTLPISDRLLLDIKGFFYHQKEIDIYIPGINYDADLAGAQLTSKLLFNDSWRFEAYGRAFHAWSVGGGMNYPFKETTRFEPGISFIFDSSAHLAYVDLHVESFITKNFKIVKSEVLGLLGAEVHYLFRPDCALQPQIETSFRSVNLYDGNFENVETLWLQCGMPFLEKIIIGLYEFQHSHFSHLTSNYFSYHNQFCNFIGAKLHIPFKAKTSLDLIYQHNWQLSKGLIQPIGNFIFIANTQLLTGNKITALLTYRLKDTLRISAEGHYFRNTLPYRDWNIKSSLLWQF